MALPLLLSIGGCHLLHPGRGSSTPGSDGLFARVGTLAHAQVNHWYGLFQGSIWRCGDTGDGDIYSLKDGSAQGVTFTGDWTGGHENGRSIVVGSTMFLIGGGGDSITGEWMNSEWDTLDLIAHTWKSDGSGPVFTHFLAVAADGTRIFAIGGDPDRDTLGSTGVSILDTQGNTWTTGTPLPAPRAEHGAAIVGSTLLVAGGVCDGMNCPGAGNGLSLLSSTLTLDLSSPSASWADGAPLPVPVEQLFVVAVADRFYALGGASRDGYPQDQTDVLTWAPGEPAWQKKGSLPAGVATVAALSDGARLVLVASEGQEVVAFEWTP